MEENNNNYNLIKKEEPIIKNICYDDQTGNIILIDNKGNSFLCDIFGRKKLKFFPWISGNVNAIDRKNYSLTSRNAKSNKFLTEIDSSINKTTKETKYIDYFPSTRKFEGYNIFPRPIVPPYSNLPSQEKIEKNRTIINKCLSTYFTNDKNKNYVIKKNENKGLSFLTKDLNEYDTLKYNGEKLLKVIDETFEAYNEKYKYKLNDLKKDPTIKALTKFRNSILQNKEITIINGKKLKEYNPQIKEKYNIIHNTLKKETLINDISNRRNNYKLKNCNTFSKIKKIQKLKINQLLNKNNNIDKLNSICNSSRDLTLGKKIKMNFGIFSYEEEAKKKKERLKNIEEYLNKKENKKMVKNEINDKKDKEKGDIDEQKEDDISFISIISDKEKNKKFNKYNIKGMNKLNIMNENEKNMLKGFMHDERKKEKVFVKILKPKLKSNGQHFIKDIELLKKTNPIVFQIEEKKEERNLKLLEKKMKALRININNVLKVNLYKK